MNSQFAKIVYQDGGQWMSDKDGVSIGSQFSTKFKEIITFINCRKNGVPIGSDYGWYADGTRCWYNFWETDGSGKLLKWRTWSRNGFERCSEDALTCSVCHEVTDCKTTVMLSCVHQFHYDCIQQWMRRANDCPVCRTLVTNAVCSSSPLWLCRVLAKNIEHNCVLICDIFGNQMWIQSDFHIFLPGYDTAPNRPWYKEVPKALLLAIDRSCNVIQYSNELGEKVFVGNVTSELHLPTFKFPQKQFLKENSLIGCENLLYNVK